MAKALAIIEPARVAGGLGGHLLDSARYAVDEDKDIIAYALVALYADGRTCVGGGADFPDDCMMNRFAFVGMCNELVRDHLVTNDTARRIVNRANGFDD